MASGVPPCCCSCCACASAKPASAFTLGEIITGSSSGAQATILSPDISNSKLFISANSRFKTGETINNTATILDTIVRHKSLTNFKSEIQRANTAISDDSNEDLTSRIQRANKSLRQSLKGTEPTVIKSDEIAKESSKLLNSMIKEKQIKQYSL